MPIRLLVFALFMPVLFAGCMAQRDTPEMDTEMEGSGPPMNVLAYLYGTWDYTMNEIGGTETITGTLVLEEAPAASRMTTSNGVDAPLVIEEMNLTNANFVLTGTVQDDDEPLPLTLAGALNGDEMSAEANVSGMGAYALTATRRRP